ncbi:hypothetical protein CK203_037954 [Vitis vinifera]|uniref:Uncharacterized protein n=1 Tax=Vitis vinifera TaxID=29760 RepID=A0A438HNP6_VITVI|nr:hypothetical protein CK203_037954 [Vitis vinifera]
MEPFKPEKEESTSLSLKKPKQKGFAGRGLPQSKIFVEEISRKLKEKNRVEIGAKQSKNRGKTELCEISQVKKPLRNEHFVAKPFRNTVEVSARFRSCEVIWHTSATSQTGAHLQLRNALRSVKPDFAPKVPFRRVFRNCESGFGTRVPLRSTVTSISQLRNALRSCCENGILLRNWRFVAKLKLTLRLPFFLFIPVI